MDIMLLFKSFTSSSLPLNGRNIPELYFETSVMDTNCHVHVVIIVPYEHRILSFTLQSCCTLLILVEAYLMH